MEMVDRCRLYVHRKHEAKKRDGTESGTGVQWMEKKMDRWMNEADVDVDGKMGRTRRREEGKKERKRDGWMEEKDDK